MRLSATLAACIALSWPLAAAGATRQVDGARADSAVATVEAAPSPETSPRPSDYVTALTREAMAAHVSGGRSLTPPPPAAPSWTARLDAAVSWVRTQAHTAARLVGRPAVRDLVLPLLLLIPTTIVVWRHGAARGREEALRSSSARIHTVHDLAATGARVGDIARRTHMAQEGVALAVRLGDRRSEVIR